MAEDAECPKCLGAGYLRLDVPINDPNFGHLITCDCKLQEKALRNQRKLVELSNLQGFEDLTFDQFNPAIPGARAPYLDCKEYATRMQGWLFLFGTYGCGKTHLAAAIANEAVRNDQNVMFMVVPDLLDHLRATFGPSSEVEYDHRFDTIRNVFLLILDDLGTENTTPWAREKLFQLLNHRYNQRLSTVITSNRDLDQLDPRLQSRLMDSTLCKRVLIKAGDFRRLSLEQRYNSRRFS